MKVRNIQFGFLGNGITVYDTLHEKHGDYETLAHINRDRKVTFYSDDIAEPYKECIKTFAKEEDPSISISQPEQKVFLKRAGGGNE